MLRNTKVLTIYVELNPGRRLSAFLKDVRTNGLTLRNLQIDSEITAEQDVVCFQATIKAEKKQSKEKLLSALRSCSSVPFLEEL